jgi:hypothetical protein
MPGGKGGALATQRQSTPRGGEGGHEDPLRVSPKLTPLHPHASTIAPRPITEPNHKRLLISAPQAQSPALPVTPKGA